MEILEVSEEALLAITGIHKKYNKNESDKKSGILY